jgi:hypothetical protein
MSEKCKTIFKNIACESWQMGRHIKPEVADGELIFE